MISHNVRIWKAWHCWRFTTRRKIATGIERLLAAESINRRSKLASLIVDRPSQKDISYLLPYVDGACVGWGGCLCCWRRSVAPPRISWFPRASRHQIPPNLICHSAPPCPISWSSAPLNMGNNVNGRLWQDPLWSHLVDTLGQRKGLCAAPSTHLLPFLPPSSSASTHHSSPPQNYLFKSNLYQVVAEPGQSMSSLALVGAPRGESGQPGTRRWLFLFIPLSAFVSNITRILKLSLRAGDLH